MGSEFSTSKAATRLPPHDTLYLALSFVCYSTAEVKILKVNSRVSYYCSMGPGRSSEPKQQCRVERPLKTNLNSLWHRTFIYPADTGSIAPGRAWHSHAPYFIHSLWINNTDSDGPTHTQVCQDVSVRVCESVHLLYVYDKSDRTALPRAVLEKLLLCSMIELPVFFLSSPHLHPVSVLLLNFFCCPPLSFAWNLVWCSDCK